MAMVYDVPGLFVRMIERNRRPINFFSFFTIDSPVQMCALVSRLFVFLTQKERW